MPDLTRNLSRRFQRQHPVVAIVVLVGLAFGGGISLAYFSFNSSERGTTVSRQTPELRYAPPTPAKQGRPETSPTPDAQMRASIDLRIAAASDPLKLFAAGHGDQAEPVSFSEVTPRRAQVGLDQMMEFTFAAKEPDAPAALLAATASSAPVAYADFAALETASVPEPGTVLLLAIGGAALVARRFRRSGS